MINTFRNIKSSKVEASTELDCILDIIKNNPNKDLIATARSYGKYTPEYDAIKESLPTVRFNFNFQSKASNQTITGATNYIYIDIDDNISIDMNNPLIHACWKSLSATGFGVLVKVTGLNIENFSDTYNDISNKLGVATDAGARKATQQTVLSYDEELYFNEASEMYEASTQKHEVKLHKEREERLMQPSVVKKEHNGKLRFNNIGDFFQDNDVPFIYFKEKVSVCLPFVKNTIEDGSRNKAMFYYTSQVALLNPQAGESFLMAVARSINSRFIHQYTEQKIVSIVTSIIKKRNEGSLSLLLNKDRRILFNPKYKLSAKEKRIQTANRIAEMKKENTQQEIYDSLENWDFVTNSKITIAKLAKVAGKTSRTIDRYFAEENGLKNFMRELNGEFKSEAKSSPKRAKTTKTIVIDEVQILGATINSIEVEEIEVVFEEPTGIFTLSRIEVEALVLQEEADKLADILENVDPTFSFDKTLETLTIFDFTDYKKVPDCKFLIPSQLFPYWELVKQDRIIRELLAYKMIQEDFDIDLLYYTKRLLTK